MQDKQIQYAVDQLTGVVTLNRPDSRNAITTQMWKSLPRVLETLQNSGARVIVVTGSGDAFASGADLTELNQLHDYEQAKEFWTAIENCLNYIWHFELPVIAMVNGACVGGGCLLATACDLRYASRSAVFGMPVARLGIVLDDESIARLVAIVGDSYARHMLFTGTTIDSREAERCGLINKVFENGQLQSEVMRLAASIISNEAASVTEAKRSLSRIRHNIHKSSKKQRDLIIESYLSPELRLRVEKVLRHLQEEQQ